MTGRGTAHHRWRLAAVRRHGQLAIALVGSTGVLEVLRFPARGTDSRAAIRIAVTAVAEEYAVKRIIVEPGSVVESVLRATALDVVPLTIEDAAALTLPNPAPTLRDIYRGVVTAVPKLSRFVTVLHATDEVASSPDERWRTVILLAALLGLADAGRSPSST